MDTRLLKVFSAVARHGGLAAAARELHLTPSALSHALKALESEVGCRLFERTGNKLVLNYAGEQLLAAIDQPLRAIDAAADSIKQLGRWGHGRLRIGTSVSVCQHILPHVFRELRKEFPKLQLLVETANMPQLTEMLRAHRIDLAIGVESEPAPDLETRALFEDELLFVLSADHPWTDGRPLSHDDIRHEALILYQRSSPTSQLLNHYFEGLQIEPISTMEIASITGIKAMVQMRLGVSVLAPWALDAELCRGVLRMRPLGPKPLRRRWVVAHLAQHRLSLPEERLFKLCIAQLAGMRLDRKDLPEPGRIRLR